MKSSIFLAPDLPFPRFKALISKRPLKGGGGGAFEGALMEIRVIKGTVMGVWLSAARPLRGGDKIFIKRPALAPKDRFQRAQEKWSLSSLLLCTIVGVNVLLQFGHPE